MGKQQEILPEIIQLVDKRRASIGLILGGSIALGEERPDSDLDLFAIAESPAPPKLTRFKFISEKNGCTLSERKTRTFPIHFACWTDTSLDDLLDTRPYVAYPLLKGRIVLDRDGIARRYRQRIRQTPGLDRSVGTSAPGLPSRQEIRTDGGSEISAVGRLCGVSRRSLPRRNHPCAQQLAEQFTRPTNVIPREQSYTLLKRQLTLRDRNATSNENSAK